MEKIYVSSPGRLEKLRQRLCDADHIQMLPLGQLVRSLRICNEGIIWSPEDAQESIVTDNVLCILLLLPRLERFTMDVLTTTQTHLIAVSRNASNVTFLSLFIDAAMNGVVEIINKFCKLRSLALQFTDDDDGWLLSAERSLRLPTVTHMTWIASAKEKDMLLLLSRCRFASECHMQITVDEASPEHVGVLRPFFHAHTILGLNIAMPVASLSVLSAEIMRIPSVEFDGAVPSLKMMKTRPLPDTITIQNLNVNNENEAKLWELLAELCAGSDVLAKSTTLRICRGEEQDWGWVERAAGDAGTRDALFVGRLLPWAAQLHRRGIIIVDKYARDVSGLVPR
jgi:hypothetical protein